MENATSDCIHSMAQWISLSSSTRASFSSILDHSVTIKYCSISLTRVIICLRNFNFHSRCNVLTSWGGTSKDTVRRSTLEYVSMQGMMKKIPGPRAPPVTRRPSLKMTALSYSWTTWEEEWIRELSQARAPRDANILEAHPIIIWGAFTGTGKAHLAENPSSSCS